ncbi:MAG TPA: glycosyltransferase family 39 protein [Bryobacteraceae bacterium]|nr:glycosyltransferase family 39 protein [Bryobacteraceae bacterium]
MSRSWLIVPLLLLYVLHLGGVGFLGPDEPRYASIGRDMAATGDWITPRLNTQPWFEKPPLAYWLTALGHFARLPDEWAARLPEALISVAFLIFFYVTLAREFTPRLALAATSILATSAGWMAYSFAALTDLPMSAALGAAILIAVFDERRALLAGALLGLSILGKGFVPVVLFAPVLLIARKRFHILAATVIVAAPWFILCSLRNGPAFWDDFFWKQHVARFLTPSLEHVQPFWYYIPVLLAGLFPWTPLALLLTRRQIYTDRRLLLLAAWLLYGLLFFSVARNKLPGYLLPLLPGFAILLAAAWESTRSKTIWLAASAVLLIVLPTVTSILPDALLSGLSRTHVAFAPIVLLFLIPALAVWMLSKKPEHALLSVALAAAIGVVYLKYTTFPALDTTVSVRSFWRSNQDAVSTACVDHVTRTLQYGLDYYAAHELPPCAATTRSPRITTQDHRLIME